MEKKKQVAFVCVRYDRVGVNDKRMEIKVQSGSKV